MATNQKKLIVTLVAILLAVIVVSAGVLFMLPSTDEPGAPLLSDETQTSTTPSTTTQQDVSGSGFNVSIFQSTAFRALNLQLITGGRLPVQAPAGTGKANPFL